MEFNVNNQEKYTVVDLSGSLDLYSAVELKILVEEIIEKGVKELVFNFENVAFIDSSGIGMIIKLYNLLENNSGSFVIACIKPIIEKVFKVSGLNDYFNIISDEEFKKKYAS